MVQTAIRFKYLHISILVTFLFLSSCAVFRGHSDQCILIPEENRIIGNDKDAVTIKSKHDNYKIPKIIEQFLHNNWLTRTNYKEPRSQYVDVDSITGNIKIVSNYNTKSKLRGGYIIEGCRDTAWAKKEMANHLLKKYKLTRIDSFIIRDTFRYSFIKDSIHLLTPHTDPNVIIGSGDFRGNLSCRGCPIGAFVGCVLSKLDIYKSKIYDRRHWGKPDQSFDDIDMLRKDKYVFKYYYEQKKGIDLDVLIPDLQRMYGILLAHESTDTLKMGYYILQE